MKQRREEETEGRQKTTERSPRVSVYLLMRQFSELILSDGKASSSHDLLKFELKHLASGLG